MIKDNISKLVNCYGCGVCVIGCPTKIIDLQLNKEGFYSPVINNQDKCINCGICLDICAFNHEELANTLEPSKIKAFGCWSKDDDVRNRSTTGGMGFEIGRVALSQNKKICAVRYNKDASQAEHYIATSIKELQEAQGSKYIPSWTQHGFKEIKRKSQYVIFGLPCQIDSMRRYVNRFKEQDNFTLVDLFCYGTPSLLLWRRYLDDLNLNSRNLKKVKFRSKYFGWHNSSCIEIEEENRRIVQSKKVSLFYKLFFTNTCLNTCCYKKCKYKLLASSADIRIGDFWGGKYAGNDQGVNSLISFTEKGDKLVNELREDCVFEPATVEESLEGQMSKNAPSSPFRKYVIWGLQKKLSLKMLYTSLKMITAVTSPKSIIRKIKKAKYEYRKDK